jgi:hypothetical protein
MLNRNVVELTHAEQLQVQEVCWLKYRRACLCHMMTRQHAQPYGDGSKGLDSYPVTV